MATAKTINALISPHASAGLKRGERVVQDNLKAVQRGYEELIEVPREVMLSTAAADERNAGLRVI